MNKLIGWVFVVIGVLMLLPLLGLTFLSDGSIDTWLIMLGYLVIGIMWLMHTK
jgi:hypothetical protein